LVASVSRWQPEATRGLLPARAAVRFSSIKKGPNPQDKNSGMKPEKIKS
jgi:hypothetical protein